MPRPVSWLPRLGEIRRTVAGSSRSHYGRRDLQVLFQLQARAAGKLLEVLPTVRIATSLLVERDALARFLDAVRDAGDDAGDVAGVRLMQRAAKQSASRARPRKLLLQDFEPLSCDELPEWIELSPGRVVLRFESGEQLVESCILLSRIFYSDFEAFGRRYVPEEPGARERREEWERGRAEMRELFDGLPGVEP